METTLVAAVIWFFMGMKLGCLYGKIVVENWVLRKIRGPEGKSNSRLGKTSKRGVV